MKNEQAFPAVKLAVGDMVIGSDGMTLRDWFAGQALAGICANAKFSALRNGEICDPYIGTEQAAEEAYKVSDAILAERERREKAAE